MRGGDVPGGGGGRGGGARRSRPALADAETAAQARSRGSRHLPSGGERKLRSRAHFVLGFVAASSNPVRATAAVDEFVRSLDLDGDNLDVANALAWVTAQDADPAKAARASRWRGRSPRRRRAMRELPGTIRAREAAFRRAGGRPPGRGGFMDPVAGAPRVRARRRDVARESEGSRSGSRALPPRAGQSQTPRATAVELPAARRSRGRVPSARSTSS